MSDWYTIERDAPSCALRWADCRGRGFGSALLP